MIQEVWLLFRRAVWAAHIDGCYGIAKAAAYSGLLSFFPVLTTLATLLVQANAEQVSRNLSRFLFEVVPPGAEEFVLHVFSVRGQRPTWLIVTATLIAIWAASGVMVSIIQGFQAAYRTPSTRHWATERLVAIFLVFVVAIPAVGASALLIFAGTVEQRIATWIGLLPEGQLLVGRLAWVSRAITYLIAILASVSVTALLYRFGPHKKHETRRLWPGAALATLLWSLVTTFFAWYVQNIANYNVLYGSIGAGIALLVWLYFLAAIALIGCEFNAEGERLLKEGSRSRLFS